MQVLKKPLWIFTGFSIYISILEWHCSHSIPTQNESEVLSTVPLIKSGVLGETPRITDQLKASRIYESFLVKETPPATGMFGNQRSQPHEKATNESQSNNQNRVARVVSTDMLSRNISIILENLLKRYEQSQLPTHGQGIPTVVQTNILIRSMGPVSELDMEYSMDCYFRQYWRDRRLSFKGPIKSLSLSIKMLDKIWRPDTYFYNGKHSHIHTITVPNKLLRLDQDGGILYSMRLTIKATCPMELKNFPMDRQSCPLIIGSYGYTNQQLVYEWKNQDDAVSFVPGMTLNQFDLIGMMHRNFTSRRREGDFSVLHVAFNLKRHTGYFLIQVYVPCILIVVLSWVSFWIHREATSDRVGLCVTAVLTLSTISLDSRTDLPKVKYATALDWFLLMSFLYCIATLLEFAGVHYFTKLGSGEIPRLEEHLENIRKNNMPPAHVIEANEEISDEDLEDADSDDVSEQMNSEHDICICSEHDNIRFESAESLPIALDDTDFRKRNALTCPIFNHPTYIFPKTSSRATTMERTTQTEPPVVSRMRQMWLCLKSDQKFRKQRERDAAAEKTEQGRNVSYVNSVSLIDRIARIAFPMSFALFNLLYWLAYGMYKKEFSWSTIKT
ncbi:gamma-aminobutyric acid receptor subunit alpha-6 [Drosophila madeirensis]|uniref:Gamma-aminobutyric acid receptor subunit alpha-6 n=2 Tax=Drosophila madeirensis TaxID=30013 RepID=A0AAU9FWT7_DROMD